MTLTPLFGHRELRHRLSAAIATNRLPQVLLVTGPSGVGKQRLALWLAQRLLCERGGEEPCGECVACRRVLELAHPDVHWLVPVPRPKAGESDKQVDEVAESLEAAMAERRTTGRWSPPDGMSSHGIASARLLQRRAALTAAEGGWRVFIVGRAERLVPQESSPEAANALLKLLEEPPERALFVLTTAEPGLVLPTIRSRAVPLRLGRLDDADVQAYAGSAGIEADAAAVAEARGSIGRLVAGADAGRTAAAKAADVVLEAVEGTPADRAALAMRQPLSGARGDFTLLLAALAGRYAERARAAAARPAGRARAARAAEAIERVLETRERAQGNVNPQLALAVLAEDLAGLEAV